MPKSHLRQLVKLIRVFSLTGGVRLWCALTFQMWFRSGLLSLDIPGFAAPVYLRRRDLPIFWQILVMQEYAIDSMPQVSRTMDTYRRILSEGNKPVIVDCGGHIGLSDRKST